MKLISFFYKLIQAIINKYIQIKTILFYKLIFGEIGFGSIIYKPLRLINPQNIFIGNYFRLYKRARIETIEKWGNVSYNPKIIIGDRVSIENCLHLTCAELVEIGSYTLISYDVMITDINHSYRKINTNISCQELEVKKTIIGKYCFIGAGAKIMAGTKLGDNCIVGSNSVVIGEFPSYVVLTGIPAKIIKRYDFETNVWRKTNNKGAFIDEI